MNPNPNIDTIVLIWRQTNCPRLKKRLMQRVRHSGAEESTAIFQRLSILLVKGNSALVSNRVPDIETPAVH